MDMRCNGPQIKHRDVAKEHLSAIRLQVGKYYGIEIRYISYTNKARTKTTQKTNHYIAEPYQTTDSYDGQTRKGVFLCHWPELIPFPNKFVNIAELEKEAIS
jgi:hypothetical protein